MISSASYGYVTDIEGERVEVLGAVDPPDTSGTDIQDTWGQVGSYVVVLCRVKRLVAFVTSVELLGRDDTHATDDERDRCKMHIHLLGEIADGRFKRGLNEYPQIGDQVEPIHDSDLDVIFGSQANDLSEGFALGKYALNTNYTVRIAGKHFFSKHVAVLGNSGSGKSCTTSHILQQCISMPHSQMVMFDMHGEYRKAFTQPDGTLSPNVNYLSERDLVLPYWLLRYRELETLLVDRSEPGTVSVQMSFLKEALTKLKKEAAESLGIGHTYNIDSPVYFDLQRLRTYAENLNNARYVLNTNRFAFARSALRSLEPAEQEKLMLSRLVDFNQGNPEGEVPHALYHSNLVGLVDKIDQRLDDRRFNFLLRPIEHARQSSVAHDWFPGGTFDMDACNQAIHRMIGMMYGQGTPHKNITIIDLSCIPFEIVDLAVSLLTRLVFDFNFWTPAEKRCPIVMVYEEAHNYIPRNPVGDSYARVAVERVAKEGRKYGVSLMVISQRPSELSETVLSQCSNMVVMRMNNPEDQKYVTKVVSDQFSELVRMLPVLRPGEAYAIGDSVIMPLRTLVQMPNPQPDSDNVDFFACWQQGTAQPDVDGVVQQWYLQARNAVLPDTAAGQPVGASNTDTSDTSLNIDLGEPAESAAADSQQDNTALQEDVVDNNNQPDASSDQDNEELATLQPAGDDDTQAADNNDSSGETDETKKKPKYGKFSILGGFRQ